MKKERDEYLAGWKRARADYENLLKETARERERMGSVMTEAAVAAFLPVIGLLNRAINLMPMSSDIVIQAWFQGIQNIQSEFDAVLQRFGITKIDPELGTHFDPTFHEVVGKSSSESVETDHIMEVVEEGYKTEGRVLKPAKVIVALRLKPKDGEILSIINN